MFGKQFELDPILELSFENIEIWLVYQLKNLSVYYVLDKVKYARKLLFN